MNIGITMHKYLFFVPLIGAALFGAVLAQTRPAMNDATPEGILDQKVAGDELRHLTTSGAFREVLLAVRAAGGIVTAPRCDDEPLSQRWQPAGSSVRVLLDSIVLADPHYRWRAQEGVINLLPKSIEPALLRVRINQLHVEDARSVYEPYGRLMSLPEVRTAIERLKLSDSYERIQGGSSVPRGKAGFSVRCENVTVREALNAIVRAHGQAVWAYKEMQCNGNRRFSVEFIVQ
jgi:hypothetical protein